MFYENFVTLCHARGETPSRVALNIGLSKAAVTNWKNHPDLKPSKAVLEKLAAYFDVSQEALLSPQPPAAEPESGPDFYSRYVALCRSRGVTPSRAAEEAGVSKSSVSKWKRDPTAMPSGNVINRLCAYFGISASQLFGEKNPPVPQPGDEALKFALFGGRQDITQEMFDEVRSFAQFLLQREDQKRNF